MSLIRWNDRLTRLLMVLAAFWAFMLTFFIMADIIGRGMFNAPVYGVREIVMNSIVIIVFLQAGYAIRSRSMLKADFIIDHFPPWFRRIALEIGKAPGQFAGTEMRVINSAGNTPAAGSWPSPYTPDFFQTPVQALTGR